jgi:hypothetical protein
VDERVRLLLEVFDQAYTAPAWHGTPLKGTLRGLTARDALWRPGPRCLEARSGRRSKWRVKAEIYGIASHDLYHAGQIQMLKRLMKRR